MTITLKRKAPEADLPPHTPAIPSTLPPSVEEAYRRKCVQLKNRTNEVEDANDAARLRLARIKRQVEKLRIERAFLLEQLAKRTSANVEDSDGSPSPPPTVCYYFLPIPLLPLPGNPLPACRASTTYGARFNVDAFALGLGLPIHHTK